MAGRTESLSILRTLYRELRTSVNPPQTHVYQTQVWKYIMGLCRHCKGQPDVQIQKNLEQTGRSYVYYLQGTREYHRISDEYKGAGERSAEDTARMLGFKMPHEPKEPRSQSKSTDSQSQSEPSSIKSASASTTSSPGFNTSTAMA